jgi:undecaprenyl-diphosphatase
LVGARKAPSSVDDAARRGQAAPPAVRCVALLALDHRLERFVVHHRTEPFDTFFVGLSRIGSFGIVWIVIALLAIWLWRRPEVFPLTLLAVLLGETVSRTLKLVVDRERPAFRYPEPEPLMYIPHTNSFPSGHATVSFACAATIARFAPRNVVPLLYVLAALIAWSRVYVGAHYPLDVLAGALIGLAIARALRPLPEALRRSPRAPRGD